MTKLLESLGDVRVRLGDLTTAEAAYRKSLRQIGASPVEEASLILKQALVPYWLGQYRRSMRWLRRGLRLLEGLAARRRLPRERDWRRGAASSATSKVARSRHRVVQASD